ncbi:peptidase M19 [Rhodobacterales bacterium HKCCE2091]|nr:peptidase M19 [Rhodobacterales bacterium HKCCE2091]
MTQPTEPPVFDGHNDVLLRLWKGGAAGAADRFAASDTGHIDLRRARAGGFAGGFFAMFAPPEGAFRMPSFQPPYDEPLPEELPQDRALAAIAGQAGVLLALDRAGALALCRTVAEIEAAMAAGRVAAVMHLEGAEAIDPDLATLDLFHAAGLRSLGPVWSRPTAFGHGVPFRHPSDGDTGPGLTEAGKRLVARCHDLRIVVDTSHLNVAGFEDVAAAGLPLVATHSNAHAVSPGARNLTDAQLRAIGETGGMVGLNFGTMFVNEDGRAASDRGLGPFLRHLDRMIEMAGEDHVGLGSDFDGAPMSSDLADVAALPALRRAMAGHGYPDMLIAKICNGNWLDFLRRYWGG